MVRVRWGMLILAALLVAFVVYAGWQASQVRGHLVAAEQHVEALRLALDEADERAADVAGADLGREAHAAAEGTDGVVWAVLTAIPVVGDDADGVRSLARSLDYLASGAVEPLRRTSDLVGQVQSEDGVDLEVVSDLEAPVRVAHDAAQRASDEVAGVDTSGFDESLRTRYEEYVARVGDIASGLASLRTAVDLLPPMLGGEGPRRYLLVFQNNAEIRGSGGLPVSFAEVIASSGRLRIASQGMGRNLGRREPPLPTSPAEQAVYDEQLGAYFTHATTTPHFPRAAELMRLRWEERHAGRLLDGVVSIDPVALSYLLAGIGPVTVGDTTITTDSAVDSLLHQSYVELPASAQVAFFQRAARAIFEAGTGEPADPMEFARGVSQAVREGRILVSSVHEEEQRTIDGTNTAGLLAEDDGVTPHVHIALNDRTGAKMSYFLRYEADVRATGCEGGRQVLTGSMTLSQAIEPRVAAALPAYITGDGALGVPPGHQLVTVHLHGPHGGTVDEVRIDEAVVPVAAVDLAGRPVASQTVMVGGEDVVLEWRMSAGVGQTGDGVLGLTPGVVPGDNDERFASSC